MTIKEFIFNQSLDCVLVTAFTNIIRREGRLRRRRDALVFWETEVSWDSEYSKPRSANSFITEQSWQTASITNAGAGSQLVSGALNDR